MIELFSNELPERILEIQTLEKSIREFENPKLLKSEKKELQQILAEIESSKRTIEQSSTLLSTESAKKTLSEMGKLQTRLDEYESKKKKNEQTKNKPENSERLRKYFQLVDQGKDNLAQALYLTLRKEEKQKADEYQSNDTFLAQNQNLPEVWRKEYKIEENKLKDALRLLDETIAEINGQYGFIDQKKLALNRIKTDLNQTQYDLKFNDVWKLGQFRCEQDAVYQKSVSHPDLLFLRNGKNLKSVIQLDPTRSDQYTVVYSCKKLGKYGGCLDDEKKAICGLDPSCKENLIQADQRNTMDGMFNTLKDSLPSQIVTDKLKRLEDKNTKNTLDVFEEMGRLGYFQKPELFELCRPFSDLAKKVASTSKSPTDFLKQFKSEMSRLKEKKIAEIGLRKPFDSGKAEYSKTVVSYLFTSFETEMENLLDFDYLERQLFPLCGVNQNLDPEYCKNAQAWREKLKPLELTEEVKNLSPPEDCDDHSIFRYPLAPQTEVENKCQKDGLEGIHSTLKAMEKAFPGEN